MKKSSALSLSLLALLLWQCSTQQDPVTETTSGPLGTLSWGAGAEFLEELREESEEEADAGPADFLSDSPMTDAASGIDANGRLRGLGYTGSFMEGAPAEESKSESSEAASLQTWRRAGAAANATTLKIGDEDELPLLGIEASAWVDGLRARVLLDCLYRNDREQQLEGSFKLRLPEGATPYYLAFGEEIVLDEGERAAGARDRSLDVGPEPESILAAREGHWRGAREARFVPRGQAARAYKDTVRQRVDPALMEWAGAGIFQARVFPLLPNTTQRIVVGYEVDLVAVPGNSGEYEFALDFPADLVTLSLDLHVLAPAKSAVRVEPEVTGNAGRAGRTTYSFGETQARSFSLRMNEVQSAALVSSEDSGYFAMDLAPALVSTGWKGEPRAIFVVDTSLSSANGGFETWLDLMDATLDNNRETLEEFAVLFFDAAPRWWRPEFTSNTPAAAADLRRYAQSLALEGASDLGAALAEAAVPQWAGEQNGANLDVFLLSDGAATWGVSSERALSRAFASAGPLFAYTTGQSGTDRRALEFLARESGGAVFAVNGPAAIAAASLAHHGKPWNIESLRLRGCSDLLLRGRPTGVFAGQRLRLVGRGQPQAGDMVELELVQAGTRTKLSFPVASVLRTPLAARAYGEVATAQLEEFGRTTRIAAETFGTRFRVPGKACSLLMLESDADYIAQGILPDEELTLAREGAVNPLVRAALEALAGVLDDPAREWLERLEPLALAGNMRREALGLERLEGLGYVEIPSVPPIALHLDPEFVRGLRSLPASAWSMPREALGFEAVTRDMQDATIRTALASGEPAYTLVQDEASRRRAELELGDAVRMLSCLVELNPGDGVFARDVAQTMLHWGLHGHAYHLFLRVAVARPFEPQSYLSLARCAEEAGRADLAMAWYTVALEGNWDQRFGDFQQIVAFDTLHFLRRLQRGELQGEMSDWAAQQIPALNKLVTSGPTADLAVAIQWNTDSTDIDLHVIEAGGEHCYYSHPDTALGGHLSQDVTQGYGPELYVLPKADSGSYGIYVQYFSRDPNKTAVRTKVLATVYQRWGTPEETVTRREILLEAADKRHAIVRIDVR